MTVPATRSARVDSACAMVAPSLSSVGTHPQSGSVRTAAATLGGRRSPEHGQRSLPRAGTADPRPRMAQVDVDPVDPYVPQVDALLPGVELACWTCARHQVRSDGARTSGGSTRSGALGPMWAHG